MKKIPILHLEQALNNPSEYRKKLDNNKTITGFGVTYFGILRDVIHKFHANANDFQHAFGYLTKRLRKLRNIVRKSETIDQFEWYVDDFDYRNWMMFQNRLRIEIELPKRVQSQLYCSGEICRLDMISVNKRAYAAWLIRPSGGAQIFNEIYMPLIQDTIARNKLNISSDLVSVGVYSFKELFVDLRCYTKSEINAAQYELKNLFRSMGY